MEWCEIDAEGEGENGFQRGEKGEGLWWLLFVSSVGERNTGRDDGSRSF